MTMKSLKAKLTEVKNADGDCGGFIAIASTDVRDRDDEILDKGWWKADGNVLPDRVTVDVDHGISVQSTVGSGRPFETDEGDLAIEVEFSSIERAQDVRTLVQEGHIDSVSVFFMNAKRYVDDDDVLHVRSAELGNVGIVAVPANQEAKILAESVKSADTTPAPEPEPVAEPAAEEGPERFTLDEAKSIFDAEQRDALLRTLTAPDVVEAQFSGAKTGLTPDAYLSLIHGSKSVALVVVPDGVDHAVASMAAQKAVDELISAKAPGESTPDAAPAAEAAADSALDAARAQARQAKEAAAAAVAELGAFQS